MSFSNALAKPFAIPKKNPKLEKLTNYITFQLFNKLRGIIARTVGQQSLNKP